jgi:ribosome recycling factor
MLNEATTPETIKTATQVAMQNAYTAFQKQLEHLRTGRASPALLENIRVEQANVGVQPLRYISTISASDAQTLLVTPWDKTLISAIEKAIIKADLGLNPVVNSDHLRIPLPPLSDQRRKEFVKRVSQEAEAIRGEIRNHRRDANNRCKALVKQKLISEDQDKRTQNEIQKLTDDFVGRINKLAADKEQQIMQV